MANRKYTDRQLERILSAHAQGLLTIYGEEWPDPSDYEDSDYSGEDIVGDPKEEFNEVFHKCRMCINQAAYLMPDNTEAMERNSKIAYWFDDKYDPEWTIDEFLTKLLKVQDGAVDA